MSERGSQTSTVPVVWATFGIFSTPIQIISCRDWWPWTKPGYITTTRRQSNNQWSGSIAAYPVSKNSECKYPLEKFSPRHFGIKTASFSLIIFQMAKLSTWSITFWRKNASKKFRVQKFAGKTLASTFWDQDGVLLTDYLPNGQTINVEYYILKEKRLKKNSECKYPLEKFSPRHFGIKTASSSLIIFQRAKLSTQSVTHLCWCDWRTLWRENAAGSSPKGSCSCTTMPRLTGHLQSKRNWPTWASTVLITHPILWIWPRWTTTCSLD